jgi:hypothetical protein
VLPQLFQETIVCLAVKVASDGTIPFFQDDRHDGQAKDEREDDHLRTAF